MNISNSGIDVLCVGHAAYDLTFSIDRHPLPDEKRTATSFYQCGGGPAANAAVAVSRLGYTSGFAGYLGNDVFGVMHMGELISEGINVDLVVRGNKPTPVSVILVKPDGKRTVVNYRDETGYLSANSIDLDSICPKVILVDGHEPEISSTLFQKVKNKQKKIPIILDAGSLHRGTELLVSQVDYLVCSETFSSQYTGLNNIDDALSVLSTIAPTIVITLGEKGLVWKSGPRSGKLPAINVPTVDTTGAGDAFHGAFAACIADRRSLESSLQYASIVASLSCTKYGARLSLPTRDELNQFIELMNLDK